MGGISHSWLGEAANGARVYAESKTASLQQLSARWRAASTVLENAATQMGLLRDTILELVDSNTARFNITDDGTVTAKHLDIPDDVADAETLQNRLKTLLCTADAAGQYYDWQVDNALQGLTADQNPFRPRVPPPPPRPTKAKKLAEDAGSGPDDHGADGWRSMFLPQRALLYALGAAGTDKAPLPIASRLLKHYYDNSGTDAHVDVNRMLQAMPEFRARAGIQAKEEFAAAQRVMPPGYTGPVAFQGQYGGQDPDVGFYRPDTLRETDYLAALGTFSLQSSGVAVPGQHGGHELTTNTSIYDYYNFDPGRPDGEYNDLHRAGVAQNFDTLGTSTPQQTHVP